LRELMKPVRRSDASAAAIAREEDEKKPRRRLKRTRRVNEQALVAAALVCAGVAALAAQSAPAPKATPAVGGVEPQCHEQLRPQIPDVAESELRRLPQQPRQQPADDPVNLESANVEDVLVGAATWGVSCASSRTGDATARQQAPQRVWARGSPRGCLRSLDRAWAGRADAGAVRRASFESNRSTATRFAICSRST
jgi:hypothetical protein